MKLLLIRHGDPDYAKDSLTEKGWKEAKYLSEMLSQWNITNFYVSPYGRARDTASLTLEKMHRTAEVLPWLKEFDTRVFRPDDPGRKHIMWDWLPQDWTQDPRFYQKDRWFERDCFAANGIGEEYRQVTEQFDDALFCHFGSMAVLLSHLWGVSPMIVWQNCCAAPSSVTTLVTEERRRGIASFRMLSYGETSHLYVHGEPPAFAARFCECFDDETRHNDY